MWWKKFGFSSNPLDIRPNDNLIGTEEIEKKLVSSIENGEIVLLYGPLGCGKTSLAYKVMKNYRDKYNFIYVNCEENSNPRIKDILEERMYKKFLFFKIKNDLPIVLIIDEFYNMNPEAIKKVKYYYENGIIYSLVLIQVSSEITNALPSFINRIHRKIEMDYPDEDTIIRIIDSRLKGKIKIDEEKLRKIIRENNRNVRSILIKLNELFSEGNFLDKEDKEQKEFSINDIKLTEQQIKILYTLIGNKLTAKKLSEILGIPQSSTSKQLSRLYNLGIVLKEGKGKNVVYYINPKYYSEIVKKIGR